MIKFKVRKDCQLAINESVEGERLETKIERVVHNNEPIKDGAPLVFTDRNEGVRAATNIRSDRFEIALDATEKVAKSYKARREAKADMKVVKDEPKPSQGGEIEGEA